MIRRALLAALCICVALPACAGPRSSSNRPGSARAPAITLPPAWTPTPTFTPVPPTPTVPPSPTATPRTPVAGPATAGNGAMVVLPSAQIVTLAAATPDLAGWQEIRAETASFWLPASYAVADLGGMGDLMALFLGAFAEGMTGMFDGLSATIAPGGASPTPISMEQIEQAFDIDFLLAVDEATQTLVVLIGAPRQPETTLESLVEEAVRGTSGVVDVDTYEMVQGGPYEMARAIVEVRPEDSGLPGRQLVVALLERERGWTLTYATDRSRFDDLLPVFERSVASFRAR